MGAPLTAVRLIPLRDAVFPLLVHQQTEQMAVEVVHGVVVMAQLGCLAWTCQALRWL
jgi:hypothetical protein